MGNYLGRKLCQKQNFKQCTTHKSKILDSLKCIQVVCDEVELAIYSWQPGDVVYNEP